MEVINLIKYPLIIIGFTTTSSILFSLGKLIFSLVRPNTSYKEYKGEWALVTGSSYGLGKSLAEGLARRGMNIILVARSLDKLAEVANYLESKYQISTKTIAIDLGKEENIDQIVERIKELKLSLLVCNAGGGFVGMKCFWEISEEELKYVENLNGHSTYKLIRSIIPLMIKQRKGRIITISSFACNFPAFMSPYGAEKAKLNTITDAINMELYGTGVSAQCMICGGMFTPGMANAVGDLKAPSIFTPHPDKVANLILNNYGSGGSMIAPYWIHSLQTSTLNLIPNPLGTWIIRSISTFMKQKLENSSKKSKDS